MSRRGHKPTRTLGEHFRRDGKPKLGYPSEAAALKGVVAGEAVAYRCTFCGKWHRATPRAEAA